MTHLRGQIIRAQSGFYTVITENGPVTCHLRGKMKRGPRLGDVAAVGDWVRISSEAPDHGMIEEIEPRSHLISRLDPSPRGDYQQIIIANPDQAVFIFACAQPDPHPGMLDRFLVIAEKQGLPAIIVANKIDLVGINQARQSFEHYRSIGYSLEYTSVRSGIGIETLRVRLAGKVSLFAGPSGAGKTSLLNSIQPGLGLLVREVSGATQKGRHTTVVRQMFPLDVGGYIADTPGLKALALWDIEPEELDGYFPELRTLVDQCQFNNCTHIHEPGCAVKAAVASGKVHPTRYQSYTRMRSGEAEYY